MTPKPQANTLDEQIYMYGAVGEEGCEFMAETSSEVQNWIDEEVAGEGHSDEPMPKDYYQIYPYTKKEYDEMKEV